METADVASDIRYQRDDRPPLPLAAGLGLQMAILTVSGIILTPAIIFRTAGSSPEVITWAVFAALLISSVTSMLQALGKGRIGAGYVLLMGTSGAFIAICITALNQGGVGIMATLIVISALFQFLFAVKLAWFRRFLTPVVTGTVIMLIAVTVMPILFDMLADVPDGTPAEAAPLSVLVTIGVITVLALRGRGSLRLWAPVIGVAAGTIVSALYGLFDTASVADAGWIGFPTTGWTGLDLSFNATFWSLLPAFIFVTIIGAIETVGDSIAIQRVSWRKPRAIDFRTVQGALTADGLGNLLAGLMCTIPNTTYSSSISMVELTGVAARRVGLALGLVFLVFAFQPKLLAVVLAIPHPVVAAFIMVLIAMLFVLGMRIVVQDGINYRTGFIVGVSFWIGTGVQNGVFFPEYIGQIAGGAFANGMVSGGLIALVLTLILKLFEGRRRRIETTFDIDALPAIRSAIRDYARRYRWTEDIILRIEAAAEEALLILLSSKDDKITELKHLHLVIQVESGVAVLEYVASSTKENIQDQLALLGTEVSEVTAEKEVSLRMLRHLTSSVRHERFHETEILVLRVRTQPRVQAATN